MPAVYKINYQLSSFLIFSLLTWYFLPTFMLALNSNNILPFDLKKKNIPNGSGYFQRIILFYAKRFTLF